jgi:hypothetical protein
MKDFFREKGISMKLKNVFIVCLLSVAANTMYAGKDGYYDIDGCASYQAEATAVVMTPSLEVRVGALELAVATLTNKLNAEVSTQRTRDSEACPSCSSCCCCCVSTGNGRNDSCCGGCFVQ